MNQKSIEHIALYSLILVGTLVVGVLARQFVLSKGVDDFSSNVAFFATVIVLMAIYASLQTTFNQFLLPRIEAFLLRFSAFQTMENHNDTVSEPEALTIEDSNQAIPNIIDPAPAADRRAGDKRRIPRGTGIECSGRHGKLCHYADHRMARTERRS